MLLNTFFLLKCLKRSLLYKLQCLNPVLSIDISVPFRRNVRPLQWIKQHELNMQNANEAYEFFRFIDFGLMVVVVVFFLVCSCHRRTKERSPQRKLHFYNEQIVEQAYQFSCTFETNFFFVSTFARTKRARETHKWSKQTNKCDGISSIEGFCSNILD